MSNNSVKQSLKPFIVIAGMHRSGTSFLAKACNLGGVYLGNYDALSHHEWNSIKDNQRGHWENSNIMNLFDQILNYSKGSWDDPPKEIIFTEENIIKLKSFLKILSTPVALSYGFKDPRFLLLYKKYLSNFPENTIVMGIFRHPLKVAESLAVRNNFSYEKSIKLWTIHNEKLLSLLEEKSGYLFSFDWNKKQMIDELQMVFGKIGLCNTINFDEWYSDELLHSDNSYDSTYELPTETQRVYDRLVQLSKNNSKKNLQVTCTVDDEKILRDQLYQNIQQNENSFSIFYREFKSKYSEKKSPTELIKISKELDEKSKELDEKTILNSSLKKSLLEKDEIISERENSIEQLNNYVNLIHNSKIWKLMQFLLGHSKN